MNITSVEKLLKDVSAELKAVRTARERYAIKLSPDFNCFDYIDANELRLSQVLADLLDPKGSHAQGSRFLDAFLQRIGLNDWIGKPVESVKREDRTTAIDRDRRVDIRVRWKDRCELVIENKPWARDAENQLRDYIRDLQDRTLQRFVSDWHVVYLGGTSAEPDEKSLKAQEQERDRWVQENKLTLTTYGDLIVPWLTECMALCESDRFRWFLGEFKAYVLAEFRGERDMAVTNSVVQQIVTTPDSIEAAFEIHFAIQDIREKLLDDFTQQLTGLVKKKGWQLQWNTELAKSNQGFDVVYFPDISSCYRLRFEFDAAQFQNFYFGIRKPKEAQDRPDIRDVMSRAGLGFGPGNHNALWVWWTYFGSDLHHWNASSVPWKRIKDGTLAEYLFSA